MSGAALCGSGSRFCGPEFLEGSRCEARVCPLALKVVFLSACASVPSLRAVGSAGAVTLRLCSTFSVNFTPGQGDLCACSGV